MRDRTRDAILASVVDAAVWALLCLTASPHHRVLVILPACIIVGVDGFAIFVRSVRFIALVIRLFATIGFLAVAAARPEVLYVTAALGNVVAAVLLIRSARPPTAVRPVRATSCVRCGTAIESSRPTNPRCVPCRRRLDELGSAAILTGSLGLILVSSILRGRPGVALEFVGYSSMVIVLPVALHELGHFGVARLLRAHVVRLTIGLGLRIGRWRTVELRLLPFGGQVIYLPSPDITPSRAALFAFGGPLANFVAAAAGFAAKALGVPRELSVLFALENLAIGLINLVLVNSPTTPSDGYQILLALAPNARLLPFPPASTSTDGYDPMVPE